MERPAAVGQFGHQQLDDGQVGAAGPVEEPEDELVRARLPQPPRGGHERRRVTGREAVREAQHHAQREVDGGADAGEGRDRRGQAVGGHVGDQFEAVRASCLGGDRVLGVERDHLQDCTLAHESSIPEMAERAEAIKTYRAGTNRSSPITAYSPAGVPRAPALPPLWRRSREPRPGCGEARV